MKLKTLIILALSALTAHNGMAQDVLARKAAADRTMTDLKNIRILKNSFLSDLTNPAANIYTSWDNDAVRKVYGHVPANYKIDLRHFAMPTPSRVTTSNYGPRWGKTHEGLDIKVYIGDTIVSAFDGKVRLVKYNAGGWGYYVVIRHPNGLETLYGHLSKQLVRENQIVKAGEPIGLGGNSGRSFGSHLHFETRLLGQPINPAYMFDFANQDVTGDFYIARTGAINKPGGPNNVQKPESNHIAYTAPVKAEDMYKPATAAAPEKKKADKESTYEVKEGDTMYSIATKHGMTVNELQRLNNLRTNMLRKGQILKVS